MNGNYSIYEEKTNKQNKEILMDDKIHSNKPTLLHIYIE